jgi:hypothetical protein
MLYLNDVTISKRVSKLNLYEVFFLIRCQIFPGPRKKQVKIGNATINYRAGTVTLPLASDTQSEPNTDNWGSSLNATCDLAPHYDPCQFHEP